MSVADTVTTTSTYATKASQVVLAGTGPGSAGTAAGGGGGGGAYALVTYSGSVADALPITITASNTSAKNPGATNILIARGGQASGAGGAAASCTPTTGAQSGGAGGVQDGTGIYGGGGGGPATAVAAGPAGNNATTGTAGTGGSNAIGTGGTGSTNSANGTNGTGFGGGGGGAGDNGTQSGGNGSGGVVWITYTLPGISAATVNGTVLTLTGTLSSGGTSPMTGSVGLTLTASGGAATISGLTWSGLTGTATVSRSIAHGETITLGYAPGNLADTSTSLMAAFSGLSVTVTTAANGGGNLPIGKIGLGQPGSINGTMPQI